MEKNPEMVETRKVTVSYETDAEVYSDGTVGALGWTRRTAADWHEIACAAAHFTAAYRALAKALYALALEVAPKPEEPKRHGFVGTVTMGEGSGLDVVSECKSPSRKRYALYSRDAGSLASDLSWEDVLRYGTFTPRGEE